MPVIVFASSKGGAGKTTACVVLACELARQGGESSGAAGRGTAGGVEVALVDADPNRHAAAWAALPGCPENIRVTADIDRDGIIDAIEAAQDRAAFVLVDLEGVADSVLIGAVSRADLVIIPCQASQNDAGEAARTIGAVRQAGRIARREIAFAVLFTRLGAAIVTRTARHLAGEFAAAGVPVMTCGLIEREAFRSIFSFGGTVNDLPAGTKAARAGIGRCAANTEALAEEVKTRLHEAMRSASESNGESDREDVANVG